eukprot:12409893-Ditylum_brightwellii.AAC.1
MLTKKSLLTAFREFLMEIKVTPQLIRTDFDPKLISDKVKQYLPKHKIKIQAVPPKCQDQNVLVE